MNKKHQTPIFVLAGIIFTISLVFGRAYETLVLSTMTGDSYFFISLINTILYIPLLLYCFFLHQFKHGYISYFITFIWMILQSSFSYAISLSYRPDMGGYGLLQNFFDLLAIVAILLSCVGALVKNKVFAVLSIIVFVLNLGATGFSIVTHIITRLYSTGIEGYILNLADAFVFKVGLIIFWIPVILMKSLEPKQTQPNNFIA